MEMIQQHLQNMQQSHHRYCCSCPPVHVLLLFHPRGGGYRLIAHVNFSALLLVDGIHADFAVFQQLQVSGSSPLPTVAKEEDMSWARREQQALGTVPSRGGGRSCWHAVVKY